VRASFLAWRGWLRQLRSFVQFEAEYVRCLKRSLIAALGTVELRVDSLMKTIGARN